MAGTPSGAPGDQPDPGESKPPAPEAGDQGARPPVNGGAVLGGAAIGFLGTWIIFIFTYMALWSLYGESTSTGQVVVGIAGLLALPVISLAFMISPRTRQAGAGLLMGVAIGSVVGAGICAANIGLGM